MKTNGTLLVLVVGGMLAACSHSSATTDDGSSNAAADTSGEQPCAVYPDGSQSACPDGMYCNGDINEAQYYGSAGGVCVGQQTQPNPNPCPFQDGTQGSTGTCYGTWFCTASGWLENACQDPSNPNDGGCNEGDYGGSCSDDGTMELFCVSNQWQCCDADGNCSTSY